MARSTAGPGLGAARSPGAPGSVMTEPRRANREELRAAALDPADVELLRLLGDGLPIEAIAKRTGTSARTVRRRCRAICDRLGVRAPIQAVVWAARRGLL
jgi:DNA-binding NarL/FixJ family response regulator